MHKFIDNIKEELKKLDLFVPIVERVHGKHHEEFHEVKSIYETMKRKMDESEDKLNLDGEFKRLREITKDFEIPSDVCESYEAVYKMLEKVEEEYKNIK